MFGGNQYGGGYGDFDYGYDDLMMDDYDQQQQNLFADNVNYDDYDDQEQQEEQPPPPQLSLQSQQQQQYVPNDLSSREQIIEQQNHLKRKAIKSLFNTGSSYVDVVNLTKDTVTERDPATNEPIHILTETGFFASVKDCVRCSYPTCTRVVCEGNNGKFALSYCWQHIKMMKRPSKADMSEYHNEIDNELMASDFLVPQVSVEIEDDEQVAERQLIHSIRREPIENSLMYLNGIGIKIVSIPFMEKLRNQDVNFIGEMAMLRQNGPTYSSFGKMTHMMIAWINDCVLKSKAANSGKCDLTNIQNYLYPVFEKGDVIFHMYTTMKICRQFTNMTNDEYNQYVSCKNDDLMFMDTNGNSGYQFIRNNLFLPNTVTLEFGDANGDNNNGTKITIGETFASSFLSLLVDIYDPTNYDAIANSKLLICNTDATHLILNEQEVTNNMVLVICVATRQILNGEIIKTYPQWKNPSIRNVNIQNEIANPENGSITYQTLFQSGNNLGKKTTTTTDNNDFTSKTLFPEKTKASGVSRSTVIPFLQQQYSPNEDQQ